MKHGYKLEALNATFLDSSLLSTLGVAVEQPEPALGL